jgi:hypothetical protein
MTSAERSAIGLAALLAAGMPGARADRLGHEPVATLITAPTPEDFTVCSNHGCDRVSRVHLQPAAWRQVSAAFGPPPATAAEEREAIRRAVATLETVVGDLAGTANDRGGNAFGSGLPGFQLDCVDESVNTTTYLELLAHAGLLRWHSVEERANRAWLQGSWPHWTAVIREEATGTEWAVDSWFFDNGRPPAIVTLDAWYHGWRPTKR